MDNDMIGISDVKCCKAVDWARQVNQWPLIESLRLTNLSCAALTDLALEISCEPAFAYPCRMEISEMTPGASLKVERPDVLLNGAGKLY